MTDLSAIHAQFAKIEALNTKFNEKLRTFNQLLNDQRAAHHTEETTAPQPIDADRITAYLDQLVHGAQPFVLRRHHDITGISGTGIVADGVLFPAAGKSKAVVRWRGERGSTVIWDNLAHVKEIHGHDGATVIELVPVGELIAALKAVAAIENAPTTSTDPEDAAANEGYNDALVDVRQAITDAIEALHDHDEDSF